MVIARPALPIGYAPEYLATIHACMLQYITVVIDHSQFLCVDIDECSALPAPCSQECNNTIGSFVCYCTDSYYLDDDMRTCNGKVSTRVNITINFCYQCVCVLLDSDE